MNFLLTTHADYGIIMMLSNKIRRMAMKTLGNILWCIPCGLVMSLVWFVLGVAFCVTLIGIPFGIQCFKIAGLVRWPFRKSVEVCYEAHPLANVVWAPIGAIFALIDYLVGVVLCVTIIGIPFAKQCFKLARLTLLPFGGLVISEK